MAERDDRDGVLQGTKCVQWGRGHPSRSDRGTPPSPTPGQPLQQALSETESWGSLTKKNWWCCRLPLLRRFSIDSLKQNVECGGRTLCLFVFRGSNCWCLPYHHVFCCLHNDSGWEAETKRVAEKKKQQQKNNSTTGQCSFVSSFKNQKLSTQTWESEIVDNFWRPEIFARTCQYCLKKKKNLYMYIFCNSVIGRLIICENVCVCWWIIHVGWIFLYIRFTFKYF